MSLVLGPNPNPDRTRNVVIALPDWSDGATWTANLTAEAGTSLANLTTRQPSQVAGFDVSGGSLVLTGTRASEAALDVIAAILANATPAATVAIGVGNGTSEAAGTGAHDSSAFGDDGTLEGGAIFAPGIYEGGVYVEHDTADVTGACIRSTGPLNLNGDGTFALSMRVNLLSVASVVLFEGNDCIVETDATGHVKVRGSTLIAGDPLIAGTWHTIGVIVGDNGTDGVLVLDDVEASRDAAMPIVGDGTGDVIWGSTASTGLGMSGTLDDLRLYGPMPVADLVAATANGDTAEGANPPALHYKLNGYQSGTVPFGMPPNLPPEPNGEQRRSSFRFLPYRMTAQTVRITISDPTNPQPLRIGRLFVGTADQPARQNYSEGYQLTLDTDTKATRTPSGQTLADGRPVVPGFDFTLEHVPRSEALLTWRRKYQACVGTSEPLLVCLDPDADDDQEALTCYGRLKDLSAYQPQYYDGWQVRWSVEAFL